MDDELDLPALAPGPEVPGEPFVIVLTLDGWKALNARLGELEQQLLRAAEPIGAPAPTITQGARLDRHRQEIDALKRWCNEMSAYLTMILPANLPPAPKPEDYL